VGAAHSLHAPYARQQLTIYTARRTAADCLTDRRGGARCRANTKSDAEPAAKRRERGASHQGMSYRSSPCFFTPDLQ